MDERTIALFRAKVDQRGPDECWPWKGRLSEGYGRMSVDGHNEYSHRIAFRIEHGRWPDPCALHKCDNRPCCNGKHLFEGTRTDNALDRDLKDRGAAPPKHVGSGHPESKLTEADIPLIRFLHSQGARLVDIASWFHVGKSTVSLIVRRERWTHA